MLCPNPYDMYKPESKIVFEANEKTRQIRGEHDKLNTEMTWQAFSTQTTVKAKETITEIKQMKSENGKRTGDKTKKLRAPSALSHLNATQPTSAERLLTQYNKTTSTFFPFGQVSVKFF